MDGSIEGQGGVQSGLTPVALSQNLCEVAALLEHGHPEEVVFENGGAAAVVSDHGAIIGDDTQSRR